LFKAFLKLQGSVGRRVVREAKGVVGSEARTLRLIRQEETDVNGRNAWIRDALMPALACAVIFVVDLFSPATLFVTVAYAGVVLLALRPQRVRLSSAVAVLASLLIVIGLAAKGQLQMELSDALVSGSLAVALVWMAALVPASRLGRGEAERPAAEQPRAAGEEMLVSHAEVVKLTEEQRVLLERLNLATQIAGLAIWDRDVRANTVFLDDNFTKVFGLTRAEHGFDDVKQVIDPDDLQRIASAREAMLTDPSVPDTFMDRFRIVRETDGARRHVQTYCRVFRVHDKPVRVIGVAWDVTEEVKAAQALVEATEAAQAANRAKTALLANVSHEIRTPMNGIIGMSSLLLDGPLSDTQREYAEIIRSSADSLLKVIDDILDFSKIEAGRMTVESVATDVRRTIEEVRALLAHQAAQKHLDLRVQIDPDVPVRTMSDPQRLRQCLINLVGNAIKFTPAGSVTISVTRRPVRNGTAPTRFEVIDTGIGIDPVIQERVFEPFVQADSSTTRNFGGTGLGLSIVKRFVEMMDGRVGVSSKIGEGSTFWFELPLVELAESEPEKISSTGMLRALHLPESSLQRQFKGRVLVVEDNPVNQKVAQRVLERLGCEVTLADNGAHAIEKFETTTFDLVLMDMQMPVMDGLTATTLIRQRELGRRRTPIIALTANAMTGEYERCMAAGMDGFLAKPLNIEGLRDYLTGFGLLDAHAASDEPSETVHAADPQPASSAPVDLAKLNEVTDGDPQFTAELIGAFNSSAAETIEELTLGLAARDRTRVACGAHRLKGAAASIHAHELAQAAARLESEAKEAPYEALAERLIELRALVGATTDYLERTSAGTRVA
jgi:PAS domain S-box-containing protein